jgi:preprotein translocase subunit SecB
VSEKKRTRTTRKNGGYEAFIRGLSLIAMGLDDCSVHLDRYPYYDLLEKKGQVRRISAEYKLERAQKDYFDARAVFRLEITDKEASRSPLSIQCSFRAHFHARQTQADRSFAERFVATEFRVVIWPYFRQFISDTTARMTISPIVIPFSSSEQ